MMRWLLGLLGVLYVLSPIDLLPDFMVVRGWIDDLVVVYLLYRYTLKPFLAARRAGRTAPGGPRTGDPPPRDEDRSRDPYEVLGLAPGAPAEEIRRAYRELAARYHPDKVEHLGEEFRRLAEQRFREINEAYEALGRGGSR